jgi:hypothetical protein
LGSIELPMPTMMMLARVDSAIPTTISNRVSPSSAYTTGKLLRGSALAGGR